MDKMIFTVLYIYESLTEEQLSGFLSSSAWRALGLTVQLVQLSSAAA